MSALRIRALIRMNSASNLPVVKALTAGWGPVIFFRNKYYSGRVLECEKPIEPGGEGEAVIGILAASPEALELSKGTEFELRDGATSVIAKAIVMELFPH